MRTNSLTAERTEGRSRHVVRSAERDLPGGPATTADTRRWLRSTCEQFGLGEATVDDVVLVTSELLANAFLHARGPYSVVLEVEPQVVRTGVRDGSLTTPAVKAFDELSPTGRGLRIVAATAEAIGWDEHVDGKMVWADLALPGATEEEGERGRAARVRQRLRADLERLSESPSRTSASNALAEVGRTAAHTGLEEEEPPATVRVILSDMPITTFCSMRARIEAQLRESALIVLGSARGEASGELLDLAEQLCNRFSEVARAITSASIEPAVAEATRTRGDFVIAIPSSAADRLVAFGQVVRAMNSWCEGGYLLHSPLTPEMLELHDRTLEEARRQITAGSPPR